PLALRDVADALDVARVRHPVEALVARPSHPDAVFVLAPHRALEVDAPGVGVGVEVQGAEGDLDLDGPADLAVPHARVPDAVPGAVHAVDAEHRIGHEPGRVHLEEIPGTLIEEGVDAPHETIVGRQELVAAALIAQPLVGLGVERRDAHVEGVLADDDADLRRLGGRRAVLRVDLNEVLGRLRLLPDALVEPSVEHDALALGQTGNIDLAAGHAADQVLALDRRFLCAGRGRQSERAERADQCGDSSRNQSRSLSVWVYRQAPARRAASDCYDAAM